MSRQIYVAPTDAQALAEARDAEMWYQESLRKFLIPERIERVHPLLQPGFRAMAERFAKVTWEGLVAETVAFGSPDTVASHIEQMRGSGVGEVLCWMNFGGPAPDTGAPLDGAVRPRGHAPVSVSSPRFAALRIRDYRQYFLLGLLSMTADNIEHVISYWVMFQKFHSPTLARLRRHQPLGAIPAVLRLHRARSPTATTAAS